MVFPTAEGLTPCLTGRLSPDSRSKLKTGYRFAKKYGIRATFGAVTATGLYTLAKEAAGDGVKVHAKRYLGGILLNTGLTCISGGIPLITNATRIVKYSKACHSACAAAWRMGHNTAEMPFLVCDFIIFDECVPSCGKADYDIFGSGTTDIISEFTGG